MSSALLDWALPRLKRLLPLDDESLTEVLSYTTTLPKDLGAEHLKNMLGDSPQALDFIATFNSRRADVAPTPSVKSTAQSRDDESDRVPRARKQVKPKAPLHSAGPMRRPQGYGDTTGGYTKQIDGVDDGSRGHKKNASASSLSEAFNLSQQPEALQVPKVSQGGLLTPTPERSRDVSPALPTRSKLSSFATGSLISDLPNVRTKQSKKPAHSLPPSGNSTPMKSHATTTTSSVKDLTAAIAALELSTNPTLSSERRHCDCNASIHPLFATAPNCLKCGKIICALEGLQPCSFCNAPILTRDQVNEMIQVLKDDRSIEKIAQHNAGIASGRGTPMFSSTPDSSGDESSSAAVRARAHRDKLLTFQRENAQRTKVHDEAADYDMTLTTGATQWMNPVQRAAALKKQQQYMRELQEMNRPEWERKQTVMSLSIKNGKLVRSYERQPGPSRVGPDVHEETVGDEQTPVDQWSGSSGSGVFSNNPLLQSGKLIRPIWTLHAGDEAGRAAPRERRSVWRRVQDDNADNEQWILDGGLRGYGMETRLMEDGSQQEHG